MSGSSYGRELLKRQLHGAWFPRLPMLGRAGGGASPTGGVPRNRVAHVTRPL